MNLNCEGHDGCHWDADAQCKCCKRWFCADHMHSKDACEECEEQYQSAVWYSLYGKETK